MQCFMNSPALHQWTELKKSHSYGSTCIITSALNYSFHRTEWLSLRQITQFSSVGFSQMTATYTFSLKEHLWNDQISRCNFISANCDSTTKCMKIWDAEEWSYYFWIYEWETNGVLYFQMQQLTGVYNSVGKGTPRLHLMENRIFLQNFDIILV